MSASPPPAAGQQSQQQSRSQRPPQQSGSGRPSRGGQSGAQSARGAPSSGAAAAGSARLLPGSVTPQSSLKDIERLNGRALRAEESKQVQLVRDLKPNWTSQKVLEFCKEHEFNDSKITHALTSEFECTYARRSGRGQCRRATVQRMASCSSSAAG